ncbi:Ras family GTPase [Histomonas meleagridis]|uniref:Ras family GTPase n=1 Tax=Histomonas meleagridis TaxID=135588 RepID=UPI003559F63F|nr:Ras family GTPase [Histomonas meleagridis]KAH0796152.1 Ras family GTPase [Histomonas meleagridis]
MEPMNSRPPSFYLDKDCFVFVYDVIYKQSFEYINEMHHHISQIRDSKQFPCIICGNKIDMKNERVISSEEGKALAERLGAQFLEISVKTGEGVQDLLEMCIKIFAI